MANDRKPKLVVICGPTGIGKTNFSILLARSVGGCVVSADSMQIYRYMDIGTAKPSAAERRQVPHHMIDIVNPDDPYDAARFCREARQAIADIHLEHKLPLVVGGTGFYIKALLHGLFESKPVDPEVLRRLKNQAAAEGIRPVYEKLCNCDPEAATRIHAHDAYRVIRALAVYETTGRPMSSFQEDHGFREGPYQALKICLHDDRETLYDRIDRRVDQMVADGLLEEVKTLLDMGYGERLRPMQAIGYRHMVEYLSGRFTWKESLDLLKRDTRRFAKRQFTWFKKDQEMIWASPAENPVLFERVYKFLSNNTDN